MNNYRMYPDESAPLIDGRRVQRRPTKDEVLAYFAHPAVEGEDYKNWLSFLRPQRRQLNYRFTVEEIARIHPDHRSIFIVYADHTSGFDPFVPAYESDERTPKERTHDEKARREARYID